MKTKEPKKRELQNKSEMENPNLVFPGRNEAHLYLPANLASIWSISADGEIAGGRCRSTAFVLSSGSFICMPSFQESYKERNSTEIQEITEKSHHLLADSNRLVSLGLGFGG